MKTETAYDPGEIYDVLQQEARCGMEYATLEETMMEAVKAGEDAIDSLIALARKDKDGDFLEETEAHYEAFVEKLVRTTLHSVLVSWKEGRKEG